MKNQIWKNEMFTLALEASPSGQIVTNTEGIVCHVNKRLLDTFGYDREELIGQKMEFLVPDKYRDKHPQYRASYQESPTVRSMGTGRVLYGKHQSGKLIPIEIGLNPFMYEESGYVLASVVDISERVRARNRFEVAMEASPSGILMTDDKGVII